MAIRIDAADIVVVTVNDHEHRELRNALAAASKTGIDCEGASRQPYLDFGLINGQRVVHVRSAMGSADSGASRHTTELALRDLKPKLVIAAGIAWGASEKSQKIGDVLISKKIQLGDHKKSANGDVQLRGPKPEIDGVLVKHFEETASRLKVRHKAGLMLSLQTLFDDLAEKEKFLKAREETIGGEMECGGIYEAIRDAGPVACSYIVVKAICDWGYKKNIDRAQKERDQRMAAKRAANLCAKAIKSWSLVEPAAKSAVVSDAATSIENEVEVTAHELTAATPAPSGIAAFVQRLQDQDLDIELRGLSGTLDSRTILYWPVRLRTPNVVHAVQTFIAAGLRARGCQVRLCFDDLGRIEGFASKSDGVEIFRRRVLDWASKVSSTDVAQGVVDSIALFSQFVGDGGDKVAVPGALEQLGLSLVKWLKEKEQLREVLSEAKLMNGPEQAALDKKPRRLLTPPLVWTVLKMLNADNSQRHVLTLGGADEKPIWLAFEAGGLKTSPVSNLLIPKLSIGSGTASGDRGDMDSDRFRIGSPHDIREHLEHGGAHYREWLIRYAWHLPEVIRGQPTTAIEEKLKTDSWHAAGHVANFVRQ